MGKKLMAAAKPALKMPELLVFAKALAIGFVFAEVWRDAFYVGATFATRLPNVALWIKGGGVLAGLLLCLIYAFKRGAHSVAARIGRSLRFDLLAAIGIGMWANELASPWMGKAHAAIKNADPYWGLGILLLLCTMLLSPLCLQYLSKRKRPVPQFYFLEDEEIGDVEEDLLGNNAQAKSFAEAVLASSTHRGLVFGVDGPWGVGKTSFINLAEHYWSEADDEVIVFRFEPLTHQSPTSRAA
jgi:hypothetical protein